jgi:hypothetical protein
MTPDGFVQTPFAATLTRHACDWRAGWEGSRKPMFANWLDGVWPEYRDIGARAVAADRVRLHSHARAVTSSQVFALNLFLPFREGNRQPLEHLLETTIGERLTIARVGFEWIPPGDLLGEIDGHEPRERERATGDSPPAGRSSHWRVWRTTRRPRCLVCALSRAAVRSQSERGVGGW